jgi:hypothetical protein
MPVAEGKASPASAALAFAIAAAPVAAILRDAARRGLTDKKLEKAVHPGAVIPSAFLARSLAEVLDMWLGDPLNIFLMLLNAAVAASVVGLHAYVLPHWAQRSRGARSGGAGAHT